jgi:hypothetical protein
MFEDDKERRQQIAFVHSQVLQYLQFDTNSLLKIFYNKDSMRLRKRGWKHLKKSKKFYEVKVHIDSFKSQDLVKISKLNNDLFYIDTRNVKIHTCDQQFAHYCALTDGDINSIRYSI